MSAHYADIAFTDRVGDVQQRYGSQKFYARRRHRGTGPDRITPEVRAFLGARDSFYLATVSESGWPYVQFRGGPPGFLKVRDDTTIGWADFQGNLQYISTGNVAGDNRVALIVMDYPHRRRLKIYGRARVVFPDDDAALIADLGVPDYDAVVERGVLVEVEAFDWNCQQHITPRYSVADLEPHLDTLRNRIADLEAENTALRDNCRPSEGGTR
ncbi:pyridoxamine 5'-phosphate oxidase family protein [Paractinoplanes hotanensis]|uniref:Pyridoxamine 5'-phosphate oxidase family protein n=1 Tax=Paractinoplanes hotanensis TaxID=2906497 RepID=A0ABT0YGA8_9ACTN|nr:pyridoxamine 5'-phosphate oxidase family protein [Actinoplanes hotanensis]MCM4085093.1 pyridoxamine 5'-phosphate oxidase family protein [Actinoplanes hotanensis]